MRACAIECVRACVRARLSACVRACVRARARAFECVRACANMHVYVQVCVYVSCVQVTIIHQIWNKYEALDGIPDSDLPPQLLRAAKGSHLLSFESAAIAPLVAPEPLTTAGPVHTGTDVVFTVSGAGSPEVRARSSAAACRA